MSRFNKTTNSFSLSRNKDLTNSFFPWIKMTCPQKIKTIWDNLSVRISPTLNFNFMIMDLIQKKPSVFNSVLNNLHGSNINKVQVPENLIQSFQLTTKDFIRLKMMSMSLKKNGTKRKSVKTYANYTAKSQNLINQMEISNLISKAW